MKKLLLFVIVAAVAAAMCGFTGEPKAVSFKAIKVTSGDTMWSIADRSYMANKSSFMCLEEYFYNLKQSNKHLNPGYLQPGNTVYIPCYAK